MSSGQLARTPPNFPRMKHRAAGRIAKRRNITVQPIGHDAGFMSQDEARKGLGFPMMWVDEAPFQGPYRGDLTA